MSNEKQTTVAQLLPFEEDDEFEEFECDWDQQAEDHEDKKEWEDDWDDDQVDELFSQQLRAEISKLQA
eukprot:CAMPEP_0201491638 /NCGR_PEP_ID=MMETSP0151_2-20130828/30602_1 /ASSEMBLY_ACC=CAM_ASM_000257 /TAXON_ID=200890 /ORGANISM="Paramoeba atlantica, Strain 621/1 / CCAP 1560/9" /LENGTH=67 /DNA_ID=CAMNT_0047878091 /DNA_START=57 /DNA_END=260 /DNA_ORIENTATION=+